MFVLATEWVTANKEPLLSPRYTIHNLTSGDKLEIRVKAVNSVGVSVPAVLEQPVAIREILGKVLFPLYRFQIVQHSCDIIVVQRRTEVSTCYLKVEFLVHPDSSPLCITN